MQQLKMTDIVQHGIRKTRICNNRKCVASYKKVRARREYATTENIRHCIKWYTQVEKYTTLRQLQSHGAIVIAMCAHSV